jgi:hypothetical protein
MVSLIFSSHNREARKQGYRVRGSPYQKQDVDVEMQISCKLYILFNRIGQRWEQVSLSPRTLYS